MPEEQKPSAKRVASVVKQCPWCGGALVFSPRFSLRALITGEAQVKEDAGVPEELRTVAAWVCETALCRYREPA